MVTDTMAKQRHRRQQHKRMRRRRSKKTVVKKEEINMQLKWPVCFIGIYVIFNLIPSLMWTRQPHGLFFFSSTSLCWTQQIYWCVQLYQWYLVYIRFCGLFKKLQLNRHTFFNSQGKTHWNWNFDFITANVFLTNNHRFGKRIKCLVLRDARFVYLYQFSHCMIEEAVFHKTIECDTLTSIHCIVTIYQLLLTSTVDFYFYEMWHFVGDVSFTFECISIWIR